MIFLPIVYDHIILSTAITKINEVLRPYDAPSSTERAIVMFEDLENAKLLKENFLNNQRRFSFLYEPFVAALLLCSIFVVIQPSKKNDGEIEPVHEIYWGRIDLGKVSATDVNLSQLNSVDDVWIFDASIKTNSHYFIEAFKYDVIVSECFSGVIGSRCFNRFTLKSITSGGYHNNLSRQIALKAFIQDARLLWGHKYRADIKIVDAAVIDGTVRVDEFPQINLDEIQNEKNGGEKISGLENQIDRMVICGGGDFGGNSNKRHAAQYGNNSVC